MKNYAILLLIGVFLALGTLSLEAFPPLWFDEGWTLTVARNWVETGHYGMFSEGQPAPSTLAAHFPVVAPVALSFRMFGVGIVQGRMVGLAFTAVSLLLLWYLTSRTFNPSIGRGTMIFLLLCPTLWYVHPIIIGRQVLGEMPTVAYLLAEYGCLLLTSKRPGLFMPLTMLFGGLALMAKDQVLPFWLASFCLPLGILLLQRQWRSVGMLAFNMAGALAAWQGLKLAAKILLAAHTVHGATVTGLAEVSALVLTPAIRSGTLRLVVYAMFPTLAGLGYGAYRRLCDCKRTLSWNSPQTVRIMLLGFAGSWFAWFLLLSVGWPRYAFPALFLATPFIVELLHDLSGSFQFQSGIAQVRSVLVLRRPDRRNLRALGALGMMALLCYHSYSVGIRFTRAHGNRDVVAVAGFLNTQTPPDALIESYESELFFLLKRPYHYPPPQINVEYIRSRWVDPVADLKIKPQDVKADFLILGPFGKEVYRTLLEEHTFLPFKSIGQYTILKRAGG